MCQAVAPVRGGMATDPAAGGVPRGLTGRRSECDVLERLVGAVRAGQSRALVVCGNQATARPPAFHDLGRWGEKYSQAINPLV